MPRWYFGSQVSFFSGTSGHNRMFSQFSGTLDGGLFAFFLEPVVQSVNHFVSQNSTVRDITSTFVVLVQREIEYDAAWSRLSRRDSYCRVSVSLSQSLRRRTLLGEVRVARTRIRR